MQKTKIVFTGSVGAGKTLAISQLSEIPVISTDVKSNEVSVLRKKVTTTVAMDYGELSLNETTKLHLYGTPGQKRFDFMSHILCKGALGLIILIDNSHENPLQELDYYLTLNARFLMTHPAVIAVTHMDEANTLSLQAYQAYLAERGKSFPVMRTDARVKGHILLLLQMLVNEIEEAQYEYEENYQLSA